MASFFKRGPLSVALLLTTIVALFFILKPKPKVAAERMPKTVSYNFHIRPILSDRCFKCHGPDANQRKAELRLDTESGLFKALKEDPEGRVIVPGDAEHSELFARISTADTSVLMPPP
ncbi:MAG TPA: c-type cytochrome domain-containing protein, partial [Chryseosolibacter sp.]